MKILVTSAYRLDSETGTSRVALDLIKDLAERNAVLYVCFGDKYKIENQGNLRYLKLPSLQMGMLTIPLITPQIYLRMKKVVSDFEPQVFHLQNIDLNGLICARIARITKSPLIITMHSLPHEGIGYIFPKLAHNKFFRVFNSLLVKFYVKPFLAFADTIIALNGSVSKSLESLNIRQRSIILNNGILLDQFKKYKRVPPKKSINFIFVGTYNSRKNQQFLIDAFKYLPKNFQLDLYGNMKSNKKYVNKLSQSISDNNLQNVKIHDFIEHANLGAVLSKYHFFISASIKEVQSLVVIEALASGLPVISLANETTNELINTTNGIVLNKHITQKEFASKTIKYVQLTNKNYINISDNARKTSQKFDLHKTSRNLEKIYKSLI